MAVRNDKTKRKLKRAGGLVVDYWDKEGKRHAERCRDQRAVDLLVLDKAGEKSADLLGAVLVENFVEWFLNEHRLRGVETRTMKTTFNKRFLPRFRGCSISSISSGELTELRFSWDSTIKAQTARTAATHVGQLMRDAHTRGCRPDNPALLANEELPKRKANRKTLHKPKPDEHDKIRQHASVAELVPLDLASEAGIELGDGTALGWPDIDFAASGRIRIINGQRYGKTVELKMPGRKRIVPEMTDRLKATLLRARVQQRLAARDGGEQAPDLVQPRPLLNRDIAMTMTRVGLYRRDRAMVGKGRNPLEKTTASELWDRSEWAKYTVTNFVHLAALRWIEEGLSAKTIARRLGLASSKAVFQIYRQALTGRSKARFAGVVNRGMADMLGLSPSSSGDGDDQLDAVALPHADFLMLGGDQP